MIHDAKVEVTCDGSCCHESVEILPPYVYRDYSGTNGYYDTSDRAIVKELTNEGWFIQDDKHYCCAECAPEIGAKP